MTPLWQQPAIVRQAQLILNSYRHWLARELIERSSDAIEDSQTLFDAQPIVLSHGTQSDPILNYGNAAALALWELNFEHFTQTPSRLTAEPDLRAERSRLLQRTALLGYIDDYQGVRITHSGRRFHIANAIVWNLLDEAGNIAGQAATFSQYQWLTETEQA